MIPNPVTEFVRLLKAGREWYAQYMLASLVLGEPPAKMNTGFPLHPRGQAVLRELEQRAFGNPSGDGDPVFFWEFRLRARATDPENGWPDLAAVWHDRVLMIELKTEPGSVRDGQVDWYLDLAAHHYPNQRTDLLFVTKDPVPGQPRLHERQQYATANWLDVADAVEAAWRGADEHDAAAATVFGDYLRQSLSPASNVKEPEPTNSKRVSAPRERSASRPAPNDEQIRTALSIAAEVEGDGLQRRWVAKYADHGEAREFASAVGDRLQAPLPDDPAAPHVRPWVASPGKDLTGDYEVRFSFYGEKP